MSGTKREVKIINVDVSRKDGQTSFTFDIPESIENIYKKASNGEVLESRNWQGLQFYSVASLITDEYYKSKLRSYNLLDDYGNKLYDVSEDKFNIAWLRTVGGKGTIVIDDVIPYAKVNTMIKNALDFLKEYFTDYYKSFNVKGSITIEL